jgi:hypothetical protein
LGALLLGLGGELLQLLVAEVADAVGVGVCLREKVGGLGVGLFEQAGRLGP